MEGVRAGAGGRGAGEALRASQRVSDLQRLLCRVGVIRTMWKWKAHHPSLAYKEAEWPWGHVGFTLATER